MRRIYKYTLPGVFAGKQAVLMPFGAEILSVQNQCETIAIWAYVDPEVERRVTRTFETFITGALVPETEDAALYLGTLQFDKGEYVLHIFEVSS